MHRLIPLLLATCLLAACRTDHPTPRPRAYLRIDTPQPAYRTLDTASLPFTFDISRYASADLKRSTPRETWLDIVYPQWNAVVFLSHHRIASPADLRGQTDTALRLLESHYQFASGVAEQSYTDAPNHLSATVYHLGGSKVASTCQFWATDSLHHFLRGALYLDRTPDNDSLAPIIHFIQTDIDRLVETLRWRGER
ncbi:MAG: hypothetical protein IJU19_05195 [Bacteroidales bacterium]|nr:hypothetical protein [Bacteroidales bacterium]